MLRIGCTITVWPSFVFSIRMLVSGNPPNCCICFSTSKSRAFLACGVFFIKSRRAFAIFPRSCSSSCS